MRGRAIDYDLIFSDCRANYFRYQPKRVTREAAARVDSDHEILEDEISRRLVVVDSKLIGESVVKMSIASRTAQRDLPSADE